MRILYFTFMTPSVKFGGGIGVLKSLNALCKIGEVYYIGPPINYKEVSGYDLRFVGHKYIEMERNPLARIRNFFCKGSPSLYVRDWSKSVEDIDPANFDIVYLERTLQGFVCRWARKAELPLIVMTHNVEYDFIRKNGPSKSKVINAFFSQNAKNNEKTCVELADRVIVLTRGDYLRFKELYGSEGKYRIIPVCVNEPCGTDTYDSKNPYILLTGSLWFGANVDGVNWFLEEVWSKIENMVSLDVVIAGSNPNERIKESARKRRRVVLVENPEDMGKYYRGAYLFIAPVFDGAGMKVKVAEAMSYGLPIIATEHAMIGYEKAEHCIYKIANADEIVSLIVGISKGTKSLYKSSAEEERSVFKNNFSNLAFESKIMELISTVCAMEE